MKVFRRTFTLLLVIALLAAMPLSAFAASASRTVRYSGYDYVCYAQCAGSTGYASVETTCSTSQVRVYAAARVETTVMMELSGGPAYEAASVYFPSLCRHDNFYTKHYVIDVDGTTCLLTQTINC